jgi:hypothetical protein
MTVGLIKRQDEKETSIPMSMTSPSKVKDHDASPASTQKKSYGVKLGRTFLQYLVVGNRIQHEPFQKENVP